MTCRPFTQNELKIGQVLFDEPEQDDEPIFPWTTTSFWKKKSTNKLKKVLLHKKHFRRIWRRGGNHGRTYRVYRKTKGINVATVTGLTYRALGIANKLDVFFRLSTSLWLRCFVSTIFGRYKKENDLCQLWYRRYQSNKRFFSSLAIYMKTLHT